MVVQGISLGSGLRSQNRNISDLYLVSGISTAGDGLGGIFYWNSTSTAADDSLNVFQVTGVSVGRWIRIASSIAVSSPITYNSGVIGITQAGTSSNGYLSSTDWNTFNNKQGAITLTTTGTSGPATLIGNTLNIPEYSSALTGYVPTSRTLTINGVTYDLSANRTWTVTSGVASVDATVPTGFSVSGVPITSTGTIAITFASGYSLPTNAKQTEWDAAYTWVSNFPSQTGNAGKVLSTNGTVLSWIAAGTVTSVDMTVPTGLSISGNPITTAGTLALTYASGYAIPTTVKQSNWDDAYTWVAAFPTQTGQSGKFLTTDGSALSWADNGAGTVTDVSFTTGTTGTDVNSSVATSTTTPAITLNIPVASATNTGKLSSTDWSTFNSKQDVITLTTTGTSGAATFTSNTLNIPQYQGQITLTTVGSSGPSTLVGSTLNIPDYSTSLSGYVPITRTLTIDGVTYDLSANRTWTVLPTGGTTGQILAKNSATNYDTVWIDNFTTDVRQYVKAAEAINKGQAVYVSGADGTNILISKASNTTEATSSKTIGLLYQNLALNGHGYVITQGLLSGLDTSAATIGDPVWLGTNGNLIYGLVNKPYAPANLVYLGVVTRVNSNNGEILVSVQNGFELKELHDVVATSPVNGAFIKYNSSNSLWESVAGTTTNVAEGTNLYYTDARARSAISLTTTGNSGASTYSSVTGIINVPEYTLAGLGGVPTTRTLTINGTAYDLSVNRSWSVGTVTSVSFATDTAGNDVAVDGSPVTSAGTITLSIPVASATKTGKLSSSDWTTFNNKQNALTFGNLTETTSSILTITGGTGAVIGSGVTVEVSQASGTQSGYLSSADWTTFNNKQAAITLTTTGNSGAATFITNTLNIPNYTLAGLGGVPTARTLTINGTAYDLSANRTWSVGTVTSVGLSMPSAFTVTNSPVTGSGTLTVTGAGTTTQYVRGDGTLADFPGGTGGGGASVSYYMNGGTNQGTFGGNTYYQMSKTAVTGTAANFTRNTNGYIAEFLTDAGDPALLNIPSGNWDIQAYFSMSAAGNTPSFYVELFKYDGTTFTLIASNSSTPEIITGGTSIDLYYTSLAVPATSLSITDRLAVRFYVTPDSRTATLYTQDNRLCEIVTTFTTGITALNGLTAQVQYLATSTTGTDFTISSSTATHTFNLPVASATNTGKLSNTDWTTFNNKQNALTLGNLTEATSSVLTITGGTNAVVGSGTSIQVKQASGSQSGFLSSTDWTTFNNKLTSPMTTLGDIIYGGASGAATRLGGNITAVKQYLSQTGTGTVSAAPTWATIDGGDIAGYAITKSDDTNVTLTLGGTPATSLLKAVSITVGWSGTLAISRGGTGASSKSAAFDALSPMTTLGDLIYGSVSGSNTRLAGNITTAKQYLSQTGDGTNSAAPVWATITGSDITGAALTKTDDTNVTLTLGGTPATALLRAASITVGWTGTLAATRGGTGIGTYTLGDTLYSSAANTLAKLAGNTTATKKFLTQTGDGTNSAAPTWAAISSSDLPALPNAVTFNNGGSGAASGTTFDGSAARTISYNTIGAQPLLTNPVTGTGTTNWITYWTGTSSIGALTTATYPSLTELSYVKGVTSAIQTQIDGKLSLSGGTMTGSPILSNGVYLKAIRNTGSLAINLLGIESGTDRTLMTITGDYVIQNGSNTALITTTTSGATTFTASVTSNQLIINGAAGTFRQLNYTTANSQRWSIYASNSAESGSNAGSNLVIVRTADDGTTSNVAFGIDRATGNINVTENLTAKALIKSGGTATQYLMADGSVSTLTNPVTGTGTQYQIPYFPSTGSSISGSSNIVTDANGGLTVGKSNSATANYFNLNHKDGVDGGIILYRDNTTNDWQIVNAVTSGNLNFYCYGIATEALSISRATGASTFYRVINGTTLVLSSSTNSDWAANFTNSGTTDAHGLYVNIGASSTGVPFRVDKGGSSLLTVANNGSILVNTSSTTNTGAGKIVNRVSGTSNPDLILNGGAWSIATIAGEPALYLSSNIAAATGVPGASQTAKGGIGFEYISSTNPTDFIMGIFGTPTVASLVKIYNSTEAIRINTDNTVRLLNYTTNGFVKFSASNGTLAVDTTSYQPLLSNPVTGTGTQYQIPYFTGTGSAVTGSANIVTDANGGFKVGASNSVTANYVTFNHKDGSDGGLLLNRDNTTNDWQIINLSTTGDLQFYSYGVADYALKIVKATGTVQVRGKGSFGGDVTLAGGSDLIITPATSGVNAILYNDIGVLVSSASISVQGTGAFTSSISATSATFSGKLSVSQSSTDFVAEFINTANLTPYGVRIKDAASAANNYPLFQVANNAGTTEYFRVNSGTGIATFSSSIGIGGSTITDGHLLNIIGNQSSVNVGVVLNNTNVTNARIYAITNVNGQFSIYDYTASAQRFYISSTGAATFSSSVTATSFEVGNGQYYTARRSSGNLLINLLGIESGTDNTRLLITGDFNIKNGSNSTLLNLTATGAITVNSTTYNVANFNSTYGQSNINILNNGVAFAVFGSGSSVTPTATADDIGIGTAGLAKNIVFATGGSYTERIRITSDGNLDAKGGNIRTNGGYFALRTSASAALGYFIPKNLWLGSGTDTSPAIAVESGYGINFYTNGVATERLSISSAGNMVFNSGNATAYIYINQATSADGGVLWTRNNSLRWQNTIQSGDHLTWYSYSTAANVLQLNYSTAAATFAASVTASSFFESSDIRLKSKIKDYDSIDIIDIGAKVYEKNGKLEVGYIAQDLEGIFDNAISIREDGFLDLSYRQIHTAKIAALENKIKELEKQLKSK